jgi:small multidrug resistance pump
MSWVLLLFGIISEVIGTTSMKLSEGFTKLLPSISIFVFYGLSLTLVTLSLKHIDVSMAYAIWSGLRTAIITTIGILFFKESVSILKILSIAAIIAGVIGLHISEGIQEKKAPVSHIQ